MTRRRDLTRQLRQAAAGILGVGTLVFPTQTIPQDTYITTPPSSYGGTGSYATPAKPSTQAKPTQQYRQPQYAPGQPRSYTQPGTSRPTYSTPKSNSPTYVAPKNLRAPTYVIPDSLRAPTVVVPRRNPAPTGSPPTNPSSTTTTRSLPGGGTSTTTKTIVTKPGGPPKSPLQLLPDITVPKPPPGGTTTIEVERRWQTIERDGQSTTTTTTKTKKTETPGTVTVPGGRPAIVVTPPTETPNTKPPVVTTSPTRPAIVATPPPAATTITNQPPAVKVETKSPTPTTTRSSAPSVVSPTLSGPPAAVDRPASTAGSTPTKTETKTEQPATVVSQPSTVEKEAGPAAAVVSSEAKSETATAQPAAATTPVVETPATTTVSHPATYSDQDIVAERERREHRIKMHQHATSVAQSAKDRAMKLLVGETNNHTSMTHGDDNNHHPLTNEDEEEQVYATFDYSAVIEKARTLGSIIGGTRERGGKTGTRPGPEPKPLGPQGPAIVEEPPVEPGLTPPPDPPEDPVDKEPKAVSDDFPEIEFRSDSVYINVKVNDEMGDPPTRAYLSSRPSRAHVQLNSSSGRLRLKPYTRFSGSDSFTYYLRDADGDVSTATINFTVKPKEKKRRRRRGGGGPDPDPDPGRGGGGGGGPPWPPMSSSNACRDAFADEPGDPQVLQAKTDADYAVKQVYDDALSDLAPNDRSIRQVEDAMEAFASTLGRGEGANRYDQASMEVNEAIKVQRRVIDGVVATPTEAVDRLTVASAWSGGDIAVHPLLEAADAPAASRLYTLAKRADVQESLKVVASPLLKTKDVATLPDGVGRAVDRLWLKVSRQNPDAPGSGFEKTPESLSVPERVQGREFVKRMAAAQPVLRKILQMPNKGPGVAKAYQETAAAQTYYVETIGKERLLAAREIGAKAVNRVVGYETVNGEVNRQVALSPDARLVEYNKVEPLDTKRVAFHRERIKDATTAQAETEIAYLRSKFAAKAQTLAAGRDFAAFRMAAVAQEIDDPNTMRAAIELPVMEKTLDTMRTKAVAALQSGKIDNGAFSRLGSGISKLTDEVANRREKVISYAKKYQPLGDAFVQYKKAAVADRTERDLLVSDKGYANSQKRQVEIRQPDYMKELQTSALRLGVFDQPMARAQAAGMPPGKFASPAKRQSSTAGSPTRGSIKSVISEGVRRTISKAPAGSSRLQTLPGGPGASIMGAVPGTGRVLQQLPGGPGSATKGTVSELAGAASKGTARSRESTGKASVAPRPQNAVGDVIQVNEFEQALLDKAARGETSTQLFHKEQLNDPKFMEAAIKSRLGGFGTVHNFADANAMKEAIQGRLGGLGIVHTKEELKDPDYYQKQFNARVGGHGWSHQFKDAEELRDFAQERIGGLGMVHTKADLEDPKYYAKLFKERMGGLGAVYEFKDEDELRDFANSRLGGWGRAYTCKDLLKAGWTKEQAQSIFDRAATFGKKDFESDADYDARMLLEHPDVYKKDANGQVVRKSQREVDAEKRARLLASGDFVADPRTGNLVRANSKAGAQVMRRILDNKPRKVAITLADGRKATLTINGLTSLNDALEDALTAQGFRRDAKGNWVDAKGRVVMSGDDLKAYDKHYTSAMEERFPGLSGQLTRRPPPPPPPPTPRQLVGQYEDLEDAIKDGLGYNIKSLAVGNINIKDLEVRAGESVTDALRRRLAGNSRYEVGPDGSVRDRRSGEIVMSASELGDANDRYQKKLTDAVFAEAGGVSKEVLWMAENGTPAQRARAQAIIGRMNAQLAGIQAATEAQQNIQEEIAKVRNDPTLSRAERRRRERELNDQLTAATDNRKKAEQGLIDQVQTANASAKTVFERETDRHERKVIGLNTEMRGIVDRLSAIETELLAPGLRESQRRRLESEKAKLTRSLYGKSQELADATEKVKDKRRIDFLTEPLDLASAGIDHRTAATWQEARDRAAGVKWKTDNKGKRYAVFVNQEGEEFTGLDGQPLRASETIAQRFENQIVAAAAKKRSAAYRDFAEAQAARTRIDEVNGAIRAIELLKDGDGNIPAEYQEQYRALKAQQAQQERDYRNKHGFAASQVEQARLEGLQAQIADLEAKKTANTISRADERRLEQLKGLLPEQQRMTESLAEYAGIPDKLKDVDGQIAALEGRQAGGETLTRAEARTLRDLNRERDRLAGQLPEQLRGLSNLQKEQRKFDALQSEISALIKKRDAAGRLSSGNEAKLRRLLRDAQRQADTVNGLRDEINDYQAAMALLSPEAQARVQQDAQLIARESVLLKEAYAKGAMSITYTDENGVEREYTSEAGLQYLAEANVRRETTESAIGAYNKRLQDDYNARVEAERARLRAEFEAERAKQEQEAAEARAKRDEAVRELNATFTAAERNHEGLTAAKAAMEAQIAATQLAVRQGKIPAEVGAAQIAAFRGNLTSIDASLRQNAATRRETGALAATLNPQVAADLNAQRVRLQEVAGDYQDKVRERDRLRILFQGADPSDADAYKRAGDALSAAEREVAQARLTAENEDKTYNQIIANAFYTSATPEFNDQRIQMLRGKIPEGQDAFDALNESERTELFRRQRISTYHQNVAGARDRVTRLQDIKQRVLTQAEIERLERMDATSTLSEADTQRLAELKGQGIVVTREERLELNRGLSREEANLLIGDRQRRDLEKQLDGWTDQRAAAQMRRAIGDFIGSGGGQSGATVLTNTSREQIAREMFGFLSEADLRQQEVLLQQSRVEDRRRSLAVAEAALRDHPGERSYIADVEIKKSLLANAEGWLQSAQRDVQRAQQYQETRLDPFRPKSPFGEAGGLVGALTSVIQPPAYLERRSAEFAQAEAEALRAAEAKWDRQQTTRTQYANAQVALAQRSAVLDRQKEAHREHLLAGIRNSLHISSEIERIEGLRDSGKMDSTEAFRQLRQLKADQKAQDEQTTLFQRSFNGIDARNNQLLQREAQRLAQSMSLDRLPAAWELSDDARAAEERARYAQYLGKAQELAHQEQARDAGLQQIQGQIDAYKVAIAAAERRKDTEQVTLLQSQLSSAETAYSDRWTRYNRQITSLEREKSDLARQNQSERIGPTNDYVADRAAEQAGINLKSFYAVDSNTLARHRNSSSQLVNSQINWDQNRKSTALLNLTIDELVGENPLDTLGQAAWNVAKYNPLTAGAAWSAELSGVGPKFEGAGRLARLTDPTFYGKALAGTGTGIVVAAGKAVTGTVQVVAGGADYVAETAAIGLGFEDGGYFGHDTRDALDEFTGTVKKHGLTTLLGHAVDQKIRQLGRGDTEWNSAVFAGEISFEVITAAATGGESVLVRAPAALGRLGGRIGGTTGHIISATGEAIELTGTGARALANYTGRGLGAAADGFGALTRRIPGSAAVNNFGSRVYDKLGGAATSVSNAVARADVFGTRRSAAEVAEINRMSRIGATLQTADNLMTQAARVGVNSTRGRALASEARVLRQGVVDFMEANPATIAKFDPGGSTASALARLRSPDAVRQVGPLRGPGGVRTQPVAARAPPVAPRTPATATARSGAGTPPAPRGGAGANRATPIATAESAAARLRRVRNETLGDNVAGKLDEIRQADLGRQLDGALGRIDPPANMRAGDAAEALRKSYRGAGVADETIRVSAVRAGNRAEAQLADVAKLQGQLRRARRGASGDDLKKLDAALADTKAARATLERQRAVFKNLETPPAVTPAKRIGPPVKFNTAADEARIAARAAAKTKRLPRETPAPKDSPIPNERFNDLDGPGAVDLDSRKAEQIAKGLRQQADELRAQGNTAKADTFEEVAKLADKRVAKLRPADFEYGLSRAPGLRERMLGRPDLATAGGKADDAARLIDTDVAARGAVAEFLDGTPNWELMSKRMPGDDPALAGQLSDFREWVWKQVETKFEGKVARTGTRGTMGNDLDFSVTGPNAGRTQLAVEKFLREELEIAPGVRGLGKNWEQKMHSTAFSDPGLIHVYDRLGNKAAAARVRDDLFEFVEASQLARVKHNMTAAEWTRFKKTLDVDAEALIAKHPVSPDFDRTKLLLQRDEAFARLERSGFTDAQAAADVSKIQVTINRSDPEAYLSFGGVKQTVTYKEGLVAFDRPMVARVEGGKVVLHTLNDGNPTPGLRLDLPGELGGSRVFGTVRELRNHLDELAKLPGSADTAALSSKLLSEIDDTMLRLDPAERYQSILGNIAFYNHQLEEAGYDALKAVRRYQSSKYLDRVLSDAIDMGMDASAYSFLGDAKKMARLFYKERDPTIAKFFASETAPLTATQHAQLQREATVLVDKLGELNAKIAARARSEATQALSRARPNSYVPAGENPAAFLSRTFGAAGEPAARAVRRVQADLGKAVQGIVGDFSGWKKTAFGFPDGVASLDEARLFQNMPRGLPRSAVDNLSPAQRRLYDLKQAIPTTPETVRIAVGAGTDKAKLAKIEEAVFADQRVLVQFVEAPPPAPVATAVATAKPPAPLVSRAPATLSATRPARPARRMSRTRLLDTLRRDSDDLVAAARRNLDDLERHVDPATTQIGDFTRAELIEQIGKVKRVKALQDELEATLTWARMRDVPEDKIAQAVGDLSKFADLPEVARKDAIIALIATYADESGLLVPQANFDALRQMSGKIFSGRATPEDMARFGRMINDAAKNGVDFFEHAQRAGRINRVSHELEPVFSAATADRLKWVAVEEGFLSGSLKGPQIRGAPVRSQGTEMQRFRANCGGVAGAGAICDARGIRVPSQTAVRSRLIDDNLLKPFQEGGDISRAGMSADDMKGMMTQAGGDAEIFGNVPPGFVQMELGLDNTVVALIKNPGGPQTGHHWVRVEGAVVSPYDGKLWYSIGEPGVKGMHSFRVRADDFHSQMVGIVTADWTKVQLAMARGGASAPIPPTRALPRGPAPIPPTRPLGPPTQQLPIDLP